MKRKFLMAVFMVIVLAVVVPLVYPNLKGMSNTGIVSDLEGTVYYIERVGDVRTLYKSDATLENETLIYSHQGKGKDGSGYYNDNIVDFFYDESAEIIYFIAMNDGEWSLFSLGEGEDEPELLEKEDRMEDTRYIENQWKDLSVSWERGSINLSDNGSEKVLKNFRGIYDEKYTGYNPIGFSPDGNYFVYHSMDHSTPLGTLIEGMVKDSVGRTYIIELDTMKSAKFVNSTEIQWVMD